MRADCVEAVTQAALQMGRKITQTELRGIEDLVTQKYKSLAISDRKKFSTMTEAERLTEASKMAAEELAHKAIKKRQRAELQILRDAEFDVTFSNMLDRGMTPADAMERLLMFRSDGKGGLVSVESKIKARDAFWKTQLMDLWKMEHKHAINIFTDKKMQYDFVKELYSQDSGNAIAKKAADGYKVVSENIRKEMNEAGFDIGRLDDYRSPQKLSYWRVYKAALDNREALINDFAKHLDRSRYAEKDGSPITDKGFREFIDKSIQTIITDGLNKEKAQGTGSAANRGSQSRELHWKDADSFMEIMNKYSETNVVDMIWSQIQRLASDLTMVETFGPNAVHSFETKMQRLYDTAPANQVPKLNKVRLGFENMMGMNSEIVNPSVHRFFNNARQMFSAALLGSNTITQISDQATMTMTARAMNIPVLKAFQEEAAYLASSGHRDMVRSMGLGLDAMANHVARFADQNSSGFFGNANNALMQINGSAFLTNAVRAGFGAAMYSHIGSMTRRFSKIADLKPVDRAILESKGVTDGHWGIWKKAELEGEYLTPDAITRVSDADVFAAMPERRQAILDQGKELQQRMEAQNLKESGWLQNRQQKFAEYKTKIQKMIDDYTATREKRVQDYSGMNLKRGGEIMARVDQAEVDLEIAQKSVEAVNARRADKFADEVKRGMESYGRRRSEIGETLGAKRHSAKLQAAGADRAYQQLSEQLIEKKKELFGHERVEDGFVVIGRLTKAVNELDAYTAKMEKRIANATKKDGTPKKGKEGTIERAERLTEDAKIEFEAISQMVEKQMSDLKEKVSGSQMEIRGLFDAIQAKKSRAEAEADIASYIATEKSEAKVQAMIDTLEFRFNQGAERLMSEGERLGYKKAMAEARVKAMAKREEAYAKTANKETFAKATEFEKRIDKRMTELDEFTKSVTERMEKRDAVVAEWQSKIGDKLTKEAEAARQESILQLMAMTIEETHMASLQPSQVASMALKGGKRGELLSELAGVAFQFKSFPIGMLINHVMDRGLRGGEGVANRSSYLVSLAILSSLTGGMALLLGDIAAGRDPRTVYDENDPSKIAKFGMQAMVKGGGIGILADLLNPEVYEGRDPAASLLGPGIGFGINAMQATSAGIKLGFSAASGDEAEFQKQSRTLAAEGAQLAKSSIPFQNLWWSRAAVHNYMLNELHELVSPGYKDRLRGAYERNYGSGQWFAPDSQRAPNFGNIVGQ